jgi:putative selenium metabolism protein SsnA
MLLENCSYYTERKIRKGSILIDENIIEEVGKHSLRSRVSENEEKIDLKDRLVIPGIICAHTHAYSAFAFAFKPTGEIKTFYDQLAKFWWPLDQSLDREMVYHSALFTAAEYLRHGVTTIFDHHASPNALNGSLELLASGFKEGGIRSSLSYEVTDRYGKNKAKEAISENENFAKKYRGGKKDEMLSAQIGLHASFTLNETTLEKCQEIAERLGVGLHFHLAEGKIDQEDSKKRFGKSAVRRFYDRGILNERSIAAHCVNLSNRDMNLLAKTGVWAITNPRSNANNGVGIAPVERMQKKNIKIGIGNDGLGHNMLEEAKDLVYMQNAGERRPSFFNPKNSEDILFKNNSELASSCFKRGVGEIKKGFYADLVIFDFKPLSNSIDIMNLDSSNISSVIVNGTFVIRDKKFHLDPEKYTKFFEKSVEKLEESCLKY